jgi:transglutaminase-like putative cysteine protease
MHRIYISILFFLIIISNNRAENYLLNGGQESKIKYKMIQQVEPTNETVTVDLTFVVPQSFISPTYRQDISDYQANFSIRPDKTDQWEDEQGNQIRKYSWNKPRHAFTAEISFVSTNSVSLKEVKTNAPFPPVGLPEEMSVYLTGSEQVQTNDAAIQQMAESLAAKSTTQFDAVQKVLSWIIDHMSYVLTPEQYDAVYAFNGGKGNCQNYSHLAAALLRHLGIPVRIVNGITLKEPFDINVGGMVLTMNMAQGRHSWIEIYFPDLGWMPFDPQQTELFVSNRFIRVEVGRDNSETTNDGLVRWTRQKGSQMMLSFQEFIEADFLEDQITINAEKQLNGPRKLLLLPHVEASYVPVERIADAKPAPIDEPILRNLKFDTPFVYGNLDFPEGVNFAFNRDATESEPGTQELQKNFLVETAEYVTSKKQYCQSFMLSRPIQLQNISLALQKFGGMGEIWLELRENINGSPGPVAARSVKINLQSITSRPGYFWIDFDFKSQQLVLTPDQYWINLGYSGSPIINWFYSYGKPVGPIDGTRYKRATETSWEKTLGYEFNYRISGMSSK